MTGHWFINTKTGKTGRLSAAECKRQPPEMWLRLWDELHGPGLYVLFDPEMGFTLKLPGMEDAELMARVTQHLREVTDGA